MATVTGHGASGQGGTPPRGLPLLAVPCRQRHRLGWCTGVCRPPPPRGGPPLRSGSAVPKSRRRPTVCPAMHTATRRHADAGGGARRRPAQRGHARTPPPPSHAAAKTRPPVGREPRGSPSAQASCHLPPPRGVGRVRWLLRRVRGAAAGGCRPHPTPISARPRPPATTPSRRVTQHAHGCRVGPSAPRAGAAPGAVAPAALLPGARAPPPHSPLCLGAPPHAARPRAPPLRQRPYPAPPPPPPSLPPCLQGRSTRPHPTRHDRGVGSTRRRWWTGWTGGACTRFEQCCSGLV